MVSHSIFIAGFLWLLTESLNCTLPILLNLYTDVAQSCDAEIAIRTFLMNLYQHTLFLFWYSRIHTAFHGTLFALTKTQRICILSVIASTFVIFSCSTITLEGQTYYVQSTLGNSFWSTPPHNGRAIVCRPSNANAMLQLNIFAGSVVIIVMNMCLGCLFVSKLRHVNGVRDGHRHSHSDQDTPTSPKTQHAECRLDALMDLTQKYTVLTFAQICTTFVLWTSFALLAFTEHYDACSWLLAIDIVLNQVLNYLMFAPMQSEYEKCIRCKPFGTRCLAMVRWMARCRQKLRDDVHIPQMFFNHSREITETVETQSRTETASKEMEP